jgi:hypothetical protein
MCNGDLYSVVPGGQQIPVSNPYPVYRQTSKSLQYEELKYYSSVPIIRPF